MIFRNEVDIGIAAFYVTEERSQIVDLSVIFDLAEYNFFFSHKSSIILWNFKFKSIQFSLMIIPQDLLFCGYDYLQVLILIFRNKFFIASPGQDLGGFFSFIQGFRKDAWLASLTFVFALPVFFTFVYYALSFFQLIEVTSWNYGWNLFAVVGAIVQQVVLFLNIH